MAYEPRTWREWSGCREGPCLLSLTYIVMAYIAVAHIVSYIVMAYIVMAVPAVVNLNPFPLLTT